MKKKILFIVNYYYPYISGLSETVRILAEYFAEKGHEVTVLCENHNSKEILSEEELELFNFNELASQIYRIKSNYNNIGYPIINSKK